MLSHRRNLAVFRTPKSWAGFKDSIFEDPLTREEDFDSFPYPPPPDGAPFLFTQRGAAPLQIRHYSGPADMNSPVVELHYEREDGSTLIRAEFCPMSHPFGPPLDPHSSDYRPSVALVRFFSRFDIITGRLVGRRLHRHKFVALIDRNCTSVART
jgi:hypothetical protein